MQAHIYVLKVLGAATTCQVAAAQIELAANAAGGEPNGQGSAGGSGAEALTRLI